MPGSWHKFFLIQHIVDAPQIFAKQKDALKTAEIGRTEEGCWILPPATHTHYGNGHIRLQETNTVKHSNHMTNSSGSGLYYQGS